MVETAIALAVAAIPEGLPIVATLALARGMLRMARHNALVQKLSAVETLGSTTVLLTDVAGTLTENRVTIERLVTTTGTFFFDYQAHALFAGDAPVDASGDAELKQALLTGVLCGNADYDVETDSGSGDPMEVALLRAGGLAGLTRSEQLKLLPEVTECPFDPTTKRMATVHRDDDGYLTVVKGAPDHCRQRSPRRGAGADKSGGPLRRAA